MIVNWHLLEHRQTVQMSKLVVNANCLVRRTLQSVEGYKLSVLAWGNEGLVHCSGVGCVVVMDIVAIWLAHHWLESVGSGRCWSMAAELPGRGCQSDL